MRAIDTKARLAAARLYVVTGARQDRGDLPAFLNAILGAGVDIVQLREKDAEAGDLLRWAPSFREACTRHGALFLVNDRPDVALAAGADGVHVGQNDLPAAFVRGLLGPAAVIGLSTHDEGQLTAAPQEADYVCVGPVHETPTKPGRRGTGLDIVRAAARTERRPWFAIGGMDPGRSPRRWRPGPLGSSWSARSPRQRTRRPRFGRSSEGSTQRAEQPPGRGQRQRGPSAGPAQSKSGPVGDDRGERQGSQPERRGQGHADERLSAIEGQPGPRQPHQAEQHQHQGREPHRQPGREEAGPRVGQRRIPGAGGAAGRAQAPRQGHHFGGDQLRTRERQRLVERGGIKPSMATAKARPLGIVRMSAHEARGHGVVLAFSGDAGQSEQVTPRRADEQMHVRDAWLGRHRGGRLAYRVMNSAGLSPRSSPTSTIGVPGGVRPRAAPAAAGLLHGHVLR